MTLNLISSIAYAINEHLCRVHIASAELHTYLKCKQKTTFLLYFVVKYVIFFSSLILQLQYKQFASA